jgi:hypothetical protein
MWKIPFFSKKIPQQIIKPKLIIMDGDQPLPDIFRAYKKYVMNLDNYETRFIRYGGGGYSPKILKKFPEIQCTYLMHLSHSKEVVDKFIFGLIQTEISNGYTDFVVISCDYDFIDIFKMSNIINSHKDIKFTLVVPKPRGRLAEIASNENIEVIKEH